MGSLFDAATYVHYVRECLCSNTQLSSTARCALVRMYAYSPSLRALRHCANAPHTCDDTCAPLDTARREHVSVSSLRACRHVRNSCSPWLTTASSHVPGGGNNLGRARTCSPRSEGRCSVHWATRPRDECDDQDEWHDPARGHAVRSDIVGRDGYAERQAVRKSHCLSQHEARLSPRSIARESLESPKSNLTSRLLVKRAGII